MSKQSELNKLAAFIGLEAAHKIVIELTADQDTINHLQREVDNYGKLAYHLQREVDNYGKLAYDRANGNWNEQDITEIREAAIKRCNKKLAGYTEISDEKYKLIESKINEIMKGLELI